MDKIKKPFIIPIFLPQQGCPHQCVFCNQRVITNTKETIPSSKTIRYQINEFLHYKGEKRSITQVAFYGGNFLGLQSDVIRMLLDEASQFVKKKQIDQIRFSTRPDTINDEQLDKIKEFPISTIEIGVQSMDNEVLALSKRGHTASDTENAASLLRKKGYQVGMQMMVGLPGDNETKALATGKRIAELSPDFVRIYPTLVLEKSLLAQWYKTGKYVPISLESSVSLVKELYKIFKKKHIPVIRMGLQATQDFEKETVILAGPYHPAFGHLVYSEFFLDMILEKVKNSSIQTSSNFHSFGQSQFSMLIKVHPRNISNLRGLRNKNIEILKNRFHLRFVKVVPDLSIAQESFEIELV